MLKGIVTAILLALTAVNFVLLWQIFRQMKNNMDAKLETIEPYISARLTAFGINMVIIFLFILGRALLQISQ